MKQKPCFGYRSISVFVFVQRLLQVSILWLSGYVVLFRQECNKDRFTRCAKTDVLILPCFRINVQNSWLPFLGSQFEALCIFFTTSQLPQNILLLRDTTHKEDLHFVLKKDDLVVVRYYILKTKSIVFIPSRDHRVRKFDLIVTRCIRSLV